MNAIHLYRLGRACHVRRIPVIPSLIRALIFVLYNSSIPPSADIGKGTVFAYGAIGVVIHGSAVIGENCLIGQGVTIGAAEAYASSEKTRCPRVGDAVYIAAGARLLGDITIGSRCIIGASAVVLKDVADGTIVAGVPARVVGQTLTAYQALRP